MVFSLTVAGTGPFTYQWRCNGTNLPNGIITTVAGNGTNGILGDGGPATNANFISPAGMTVDMSGNLYITDGSNNRVRVVFTNGIVMAVAGNGIRGYSGDGGAATNASFDYPSAATFDTSGNLFIADTDNVVSGKWIPTVLSRRLQGMAALAFRVTVVRQPMQTYITPWVWLWMSQAIYIFGQR